jgi:hypothetical protein
MKRLTALALRASAILRHMGYTHNGDVWRSFDALLMFEIRDNEIRHEILKRVFSIRGSRIVLDDEIWIGKIEDKVGI